MSLSPLEHLRHILDETKYLMKATIGLSKDEFTTNQTLKRAFVRSIETIGEASKKVPDSLKSKYILFPIMHQNHDVRCYNN